VTLVFTRTRRCRLYRTACSAAASCPRSRSSSAARRRSTWTRATTIGCGRSRRRRCTSTRTRPRRTSCSCSGSRDRRRAGDADGELRLRDARSASAGARRTSSGSAFEALCAGPRATATTSRSPVTFTPCSSRGAGVRRRRGRPGPAVHRAGRRVLRPQRQLVLSAAAAPERSTRERLGFEFERTRSGRRDADARLPGATAPR